MAHDLIIRGGIVVDGTGAEPYLADVTIDGGRVTAVGVAAGAASAEIDATGAIVTPGFVDTHTHLDAQVGWDPFLSPSSAHGVTTALFGNCGMSFAPVPPGEHGRLAAMMETVEDIPAAVIMSGLGWCWESYGEYLDYVDSVGPALNVAGMMGHCALRYYAMGEQAIDGQPSGPELGRMVDCVSEAMAAGAAGFSTSRYLYHLLPDGRPVPGTFAEPDEVHALASAVGSGRLFQAVLNHAALESELDLLVDVAQRTGGRVLYTTAAGDNPKAAESVAAGLSRATEGAPRVRVTVAPRGTGIIGGATLTLPWRTDAWIRLAMLPAEERLSSMASQPVRAQLVAEAADAEPFLSAEFWFPLGEEPDYMPGPETSLAALAARAGETAAETFIRLCLESDGRALFGGHIFNRSRDALASLLPREPVVPGLGDAGAHVGQIMDAGWTTFFLAYWVRDSKLFSLAEGVRRLTAMPADVVGLSDRGRLVPGSVADVNVIELDRLAPLAVEVVTDLPGGARRLTQAARGYRATLVSGEVVVAGDNHTGARPGRVIRSFTPA